MKSARFQLAKLHMAQKQYPEALKILQSMLKQRAESSSVHRLIADIYLAQGHAREAVEEYQAAMLHGDTAEQYPKLVEIAKSSLGDAAKAEAFRSAFEQVQGELNDVVRSGERGGGEGTKKRRGMRLGRRSRE
jgi:predicted Zn-dependent protease